MFDRFSSSLRGQPRRLGFHLLRKSVRAGFALALIFQAVQLQASEDPSKGESFKLPKGVSAVTEVEGISEYRLKNGLQVLLFPDPSKETVTVNVTYKVGSKNENYGETGMAHLLEHLLFKGSKKHTDIPSELSSHGAKPNGTTWIDRTNYFETFSATDENIDWALSLESDRMVNSFIAQEDLDSEMTVVRNEFERSASNPFSTLMQRMMAASYMWHNNGKPTIGARSDIENVNIERLQAFYKKYYQPDNAVLTIAGKFDQGDMLERISKTFGKIKKPKRSLPELYTLEPPQDGEKSVVVRRVGDIQLYASMYHIPAGSHPDFAAIDVLLQILGDTPRGRLHKEVVEKKLAVSAFAFPFQIEEPGMAMFGVQIEKDGDIEKAASAVDAVVEGLEAKPVTAEELERAKLKLLKDFDMAFDSSEYIAKLLSEYIGMGDWRLLFLTRDRTEEVTLEDVQRVAEAYFVRNNRTSGRFIPSESPERVEIPEVDSVAAMLEGYQGRERIAQGEAFDPDFDNIEQRSDEHQLANGAEVILLPKKTRGESVVLSLELQYGNLKSLQDQGMHGAFTAAMLMRGTAKYSREQLQNELDKIKASLSISGGVSSASASLKTKKEFLPQAIKLMAHVFQQPSFDVKEAELMRDQYLASLDSERQDPQSIVFRELERFYNSFPVGHPLHEPSVDEEVAALNAIEVSELKNFYKQFFAANQMQLAVVGDFEPESILKLLDKEFGHWSKKPNYQRIEQRFTELEPINKTVITPDKENSALVAMLPIALGLEDKDAMAMKVASYIFGGGFLNSRLATRLRQKDGLSYGAGAWLSMSPFESRGEFNAYAIFAPQNLAAVEQGIKEELARAVKDGFTEAELAEAKSGLIQKLRVNRSEDGTLAGMLRFNLFKDWDMSFHKQQEQQLKALSIEDINTAFRRYIKPENFSFVKAGDFNKEPKQ